MLNRCSAMVFSLVAVLASGQSLSQNGLLDSDSAMVCMQVDVRASVMGFDDIELVAVDTDGSSGADYVGTDTFTLESNAPVRIEVNGIELSNGTYTIRSSFDIDGEGSSLVTPGDGPHYGRHTVTVRATLGSVSAQLAGNYRARASLTVVPILGFEPPCEMVAVQRDPATETAASTEVNISDPATAAVNVNHDQAMLAEQIADDTPEQWQWAAQTPEGEVLFPHLSEFKAWQSGESAVLSDEARYWWMFPQPEVVEALASAAEEQQPTEE